MCCAPVLHSVAAARSQRIWLLENLSEKGRSERRLRKVDQQRLKHPIGCYIPRLLSRRPIRRPSSHTSSIDLSTKAGNLHRRCGAFAPPLALSLSSSCINSLICQLQLSLHLRCKLRTYLHAHPFTLTRVNA
jgi:hypothetical protein